MWIKRSFNINISKSLPIKVLKGPRQVGKTSYLERLKGYKVIYFDDATTRIQADENPRFFLDNLPDKLILDEAPRAPALFPELKRRVDEQRRAKEGSPKIDYWITGSNQTLMRQNVSESLAGRANYYDFNTLSIHELGDRWSLEQGLFNGGWPELYVRKELDRAHYLNDLISSFIEKDIVGSAGIERKAAFTKFLKLLAGRVGQLFNASDIATAAGVDSGTITSWALLLEENGILFQLQPYWSNLNKRLIKSPKYYFEDVALATRLQGWTETQPLLVSPAAGNLIENIAVSEISRFYKNNGRKENVYFLRSKEKVELDLLIELPNQRFIAAEIKVTPQDLSEKQITLLDSVKLNIIERWIITPHNSLDFPRAKCITLQDVYSSLMQFLT